MRVLHLSDRLSARGGADWYLLSLLALQARDTELRLAVGRVDGSAEAPCPVDLVPALAKPRRAVARAALDALADDFEPDIVHVHNVMNPEALEWAADRGAVMTVQDHRAFCPGRGKLTAAGEVCRVAMSEDACRACFEDDGYFERVTAVTVERLEAVRRMGRIVVLSSYMKRELAAVGVSEGLIATIPPFVYDVDLGALPSGPPCVLFAGRLVVAKGVWDAVEVWKRAELDTPLVFAGTGSERQALEEAGFDVLGWVSHDDMAGVYRRARALLVPSRWQEPFGIVGIEALALGVPVVAWESGGVREWAGEVTDWGDVEGLAERLRSAIDRVAERPAGFGPEPLMARLRDVYGSMGSDASRSR